MAGKNEEISEVSNLMVPKGTAAASQADVESKKVYIMTAGKPASGKSTALNNIFDLQLETGISANPVTQKIVPTNVCKNGAELVVIDTPGLGARDINKKDIATVMKEVITKTDYTLLYCLSAAPSNRLTEEDETIINNLSEVLGSGMWEKCVLLFTFSDTAWRDEFADNNDILKYKKHVKNMADQFNRILQKKGPSVPTVKSIFEERAERDITAFPIGKTLDSTSNILPGVSRTDGYNWTYFVFEEIKRKTSKDKRSTLNMLKYGTAVVGSAASGAVAGLVVGASVGAAVGAVGGPMGIVAAGGIGAAGGAAIGGATGLMSTAIMALTKWRKKTKLKQEHLSEDVIMSQR